MGPLLINQHHMLGLLCFSMLIPRLLPEGLPCSCPTHAPPQAEQNKYSKLFQEDKASRAAPDAPPDHSLPGSPRNVSHDGSCGYLTDAAQLSPPSGGGPTECSVISPLSPDALNGPGRPPLPGLPLASTSLAPVISAQGTSQLSDQPGPTSPGASASPPLMVSDSVLRFRRIQAGRGGRMSDSGVGSGGQGGGFRAHSESGVASLSADAAVGGQPSLLSPQRQSLSQVRLGGPWGNLGIVPSRFGYTPAYLRSLAPKTLERLFCAGARSESVAGSSQTLCCPHGGEPLQTCSSKLDPLQNFPFIARRPHLREWSRTGSR